MDPKSFEEFQMTDTGSVLISKQTHTIFALSFKNGDIRNVSPNSQEDQLIVNGMFLNGAEYYPSQFSSMLKSICPSDDILALNALHALQDCYCTPSVHNTINAYLT